ncbi:MAG TPA: putative glycolipid-binding domain-containing protein [Polyangiaceae bacterium]
MNDPSEPPATVLWRRLDSPGHDACRLEQAVLGWRLDGAATFRHEGVAALLAYRVACDADWRTLRGAVTGWIDGRAVEWLAEHTNSGAWVLNGEPVSGLDDCIDLDLGFTPATNTCALRRLSLAVGERADVRSAWLDVSTGALERLVQRYERKSEDSYWYEAPRFEYAATLRVTPAGLISAYPGLWEAEK